MATACGSSLAQRQRPPRGLLQRRHPTVLQLQQDPVIITSIIITNVSNKGTNCSESNKQQMQIDQRNLPRQQIKQLYPHLTINAQSITTGQTGKKIPEQAKKRLALAKTTNQKHLSATTSASEANCTISASDLTTSTGIHRNQVIVYHHNRSGSHRFFIDQSRYSTTNELCQGEDQKATCVISHKNSGYSPVCYRCHQRHPRGAPDVGPASSQSSAPLPNSARSFDTICKSAITTSNFTAVAAFISTTTAFNTEQILAAVTTKGWQNGACDVYCIPPANDDAGVLGLSVVWRTADASASETAGGFERFGSGSVYT